MNSKEEKEKGGFAFAIVDDQNFNFDEAISVKNARDVPSPIVSDDDQEIVFPRRRVTRELIDSDSEDGQDSFKNKPEEVEVFKGITKLPRQASSSLRPPSAGPSSANHARPKSPTIMNMQKSQHDHIPTDTDSDDSDDHKRETQIPIVGEYDPTAYENLIVNDDVKELFQFITKYTPQHLQLDYKFKPFIPEFLPAVGDIDAFLKIIPPATTLSGKPFEPSKLQLGIVVLDEPAANQSDPALLHLQLRASSVNVSSNPNMVVKKVDNIEKNTRVVDKWIKDIMDLHKTKSSPVVKYSDPMPDIDDLMQEWPENMENLLKIHGFPSYKFNGSLSQYIDVVCSLFDIPIHKNKIHSLHLLFSLYAAIRNSQLFQANNLEEKSILDDNASSENVADQLVLE